MDENIAAALNGPSLALTETEAAYQCWTISPYIWFGLANLCWCSQEERHGIIFCTNVEWRWRFMPILSPLCRILSTLTAATKLYSINSSCTVEKHTFMLQLILGPYIIYLLPIVLQPLLWRVEEGVKNILRLYVTSWFYAKLHILRWLCLMGGNVLLLLLNASLHLNQK